MPLPNARPAFKKFILCNFNIVSDPMGTRIGDVTMPHLGGTVFGPYSMWANWEGVNGPVKVILTINTSIKFFDKRGRSIVGGNYRPAVKFVEKIENMEINPPDADQLESTSGGFKYHIDRSSCVR